MQYSVFSSYSMSFVIKMISERPAPQQKHISKNHFLKSECLQAACCDLCKNCQHLISYIDQPLDREAVNPAKVLFQLSVKDLYIAISSTPARLNFLKICLLS